MSAENGRRKTHVDIGASYAALGASQDPDLLKFPPLNGVPFEHESLLGSGDERFVLASSLLMTWQAQEGAGVRVDISEENDTLGVYSGPQVSDAGVASVGGEATLNFSPDGTPYLQAGTVANLTYQDGFSRLMRVLRIVDEPKSTGFVIGSAADNKVIGEEFFNVSMREDNTVWATVRGFYLPAEDTKLALKAKKRIKTLIASAKDQIFALTPAGIAESKIVEE